MRPTKAKPRKTKVPKFFVDDSIPNAAADHAFHYSDDRRRMHATVSNVQRQQAPSAEALPDPDDGWVPVSHEDMEELEDVTRGLTSADTEVYMHQIEEDEVAPGKRKRYVTSDDPMRVWLEEKDAYLEHLLRRDGLGEHLRKPQCGCCDRVYREENMDDANLATRFFRCDQCEQFLQCGTCLQERHARLPLHVVKEWNGSFWAPAALHLVALKDSSRRSLNFEYQLGHDGHACPWPAQRSPDKPRTLVVIDVTGVFTLNVRFCGCGKSVKNDMVAQLMQNGWYPATTLEPSTCATFEALELFRLLNVVGNVNAKDFVSTLERLTDPTALGNTPDRYVAFGRMSRQYRYLKRAKRAGVGHLPKGFADARRGKLAVPCWACPQDGFNLPDGWENCHPDDEFLYALLLALDANFRLKNRIRTNERKDQSLTCGLGVFVETEAYKQNLSDYVSEEDISTCIAFAALMQKDTRLTKGLRVSGVGGCVCARHGVVRAQGLGDLQKGERYANMDYILMRALVDARVKRLVLSYDIACQWKQNLRTRVLKILDPNGDLPKLDDYNIQFGLPVWHAAAHEVTCQMTHSLSYATGVGRTDGEGIERTWSVLNPMAFSTKEMGEGNRHDTLEDKVDHVSFEKNIAQGDVLARKLLIAVAERDKQDKEFAEVDKSLMADLRQEWQAQINDWVADKSKPNPYMMAGGAEAGPSEAKVAAELKEAEVAEARAQRGEFVDGKMTGAAFVKALLQLEDLKRRIRNEIKTTQTLTAERASQIDELRASFFKKLNAMQEQQATYMAGVGLLRDAEEEKSERDKARRRAKGEKVVETETKAEETKLWLPSDLTKTERWGSRKGLFAVEAKLRRAQCNDALARIRHLLYARTHLIYQRNANAVGQRATTRSSTLISRVTEKIEREFVKYQEGYLALGRLDRAGYTGVLAEYAPELRVLARDDLNVRAETESDAAARTRLGRVGSRPLRNEPTQPKKKKSTQNKTGQNQPTADEASPVSWIWFAVAADEEVRVHDAVRVQWAKALARRDRWREEVRLLREEMKRVLRSLKTIQRQWESWATQRIGVDPALSAGLRAYAMRQIHVHRSLAETFCLRWTEHSSPVARRILTQDAEIYWRLLRGEPEMDPPAPPAIVT